MSDGGQAVRATRKDRIEAAPPEWAARFCRRPVAEAALVDADLSTVTAAADKVLRVRQDTGECLADIEPESSHAGDSSDHLLLYSTLLEARHGLPVRSVLLLLRPEANATAATGLLEKRHPPDEQPCKTFRYEVVRVWEMELETLLGGALAFVPLAPLTNGAALDLTGVVRRAVARIKADAEPARVGTMEASLFVLLGLRYSGDLIDTLYRRSGRGKSRPRTSGSCGRARGRSCKRRCCSWESNDWATPTRPPRGRCSRSPMLSACGRSGVASWLRCRGRTCWRRREPGGPR
ncbi:MAG: hypothetical protein K2W96_10290 [Gemmataceae bacterium]|nr:hypothetical protein [Gemmataceae bacterium]